MRFAAYSGVSIALAAIVVTHAFNQRPNFYSATVYLAQSQACRMILLNLAMMSAYTLIRGLQKLLYGPLRAIEREQLWDRSWYAITETALAMTTFRDEVGAYFMIMFVCLLAGKIWAWISESRVDTLEQQAPANPKLFHARLVTSLVISELFDVLMLRYCVNILLEQPRPGMMVMFAFEFAVLFITSSSIMARYTLALQETLIVQRQTKARIEERREEIRAARQDAHRAAADNSTEAAITPSSNEEDVDDGDIDVPGWQEKGRWILFLDLLTDFLKLVVYMLFFSMLLLFHGIPIHIIRDVYLTTRSFLKRIADFQKYRNATKDMNEKYPDAMGPELERDGTCIICREDMRPWQAPRPLPEGPIRRTNRSPPDERQRPKRLPCGHVLHLGCLRSWLERQQVCPTCRTSVLTQTSTTTGVSGNLPREMPGNGPPAPQRGGQNLQPDNAPGPAPQVPQVPQGQNLRARTFNVGPWRFTFAAGDAGQVRDALRRLRGQPGPNAHQQPNVRVADEVPAATQPQAANGGLSGNTPSVAEQLARLEHQIVAELQRLGSSYAQLQLVRQLQLELQRIRQQHSMAPIPTYQAPWHAIGPSWQVPMVPTAFNNQAGHSLIPALQQPFHEMYVNQGQSQALAAGDPEMPFGFTLPEGWSLLPLERLGSFSAINNQSRMNGGARQTPGIPSDISQRSHSHDEAPHEQSRALTGENLAPGLIFHPDTSQQPAVQMPQHLVDDTGARQHVMPDSPQRATAPRFDDESSTQQTTSNASQEASLVPRVQSLQNREFPAATGLPATSSTRETGTDTPIGKVDTEARGQTIEPELHQEYDTGSHIPTAAAKARSATVEDTEEDETD